VRARDSVLARSGAYAVLRRVVRADRAFAMIAADHLRVLPGQRLLDLGCGDGALAPHVPDAHYTGVDVNEAYLATAKREHGGEGREFVCADLATIGRLDLPGPFDVVSLIGVLHHLDDELAVDVLRTALALLADGGRVVTVDPVFHPSQRAIARVLMALDRGRFVRHPEHYESLARRAGAEPSTTVRSDLVQFPYTHLVMELGASA
jgi:SAM-dependent methyltransferase